MKYKSFLFGYKQTFKLYRTFASVTHGNNLNEPVCSKVNTKKVRHSTRLTNFFESTPYLKDIKQYIPDKYFLQRRQYMLDHLYLVDSQIARTIVQHMIPHIQGSQIVCETNAGLGLITSELLDFKAKVVRLYEPCGEFRRGLKDFNSVYPGRVELFVKDIYQLGRFSSWDKVDKHNRVEQLLRGVPKQKWTDGPVMTIVGAMPTTSFITYLIRSLALQTDIMKYGRIQIFAIMRPGDYMKLSAGPEQNLHTYQGWSVLFNLLFDYELLEKFPRDVFLPWETQEKISIQTRLFKRVDLEHMYLVRINFKKTLPVETYQILELYYFVRQFFGRGTTKIIPAIEKWIPGCGLSFLRPKLEHKNYYKNLNIFTAFGELEPAQISCLYKEMINHPGYGGSSFAAMVEAELLKSETVESTDDYHHQTDILEDLEEKLDL